MHDLMCDDFFWPQMTIQAKEHIEKHCQCTTFMARQQQAPIENIVAAYPLELVYIGYLCLEPGKGKEENILVMMDRFTHYIQAYVT